MKNFFTKFILLSVLLTSVPTAYSQYYEVANQVAQMLRPALSGSSGYKGFVEASYSKGVGKNNADIFGVSTSQGYRYSNWLFMGVGIGVDGLFTHPADNWGADWSDNPQYTGWYNHASTTKCVMIPVFTDFRFSVPSSSNISFYGDVKLGCSFLTGSNYVKINNGYLTNRQCFYLNPSIGLRIGTSAKNKKQAVDVGVNYLLLTNNYWYGNSNNSSINALGVTFGYEW